VEGGGAAIQRLVRVKEHIALAILAGSEPMLELGRMVLDF
jgi:hypothetical protein